MLAPSLPRFLGTYPLLSIDLIVSNHREEMMAGVDVAVRFGPTEGASLIARKLLDARTDLLRACLSPSAWRAFDAARPPAS